jgi:hypothetical protein
MHDGSWSSNINMSPEYRDRFPERVGISCFANMFKLALGTIHPPIPLTRMEIGRTSSSSEAKDARGYISVPSEHLHGLII